MRNFADPSAVVAKRISSGNGGAASAKLDRSASWTDHREFGSFTNDPRSQKLSDEADIFLKGN